MPMARTHHFWTRIYRLVFRASLDMLRLPGASLHLTYFRLDQLLSPHTMGLVHAPSTVR